MLPVNVPLFIPALASLFAVCVCREAFGGQHYVFHPAAAGLAAGYGAVARNRLFLL